MSICLRGREALLECWRKELCDIKTLASFVLVVLGAMFAVPAAIWAVFLPSLKRGLSDAIPGYETILLDIASFLRELEMASSVSALRAGECNSPLQNSRRLG